MSANPVARETFKSLTEAVYRRWNPEKLANVPSLLEKYAGDEGEVYSKCVQMYVFSQSRSDWRPLVDMMYRRFNPTKLSDLDNILEKYSGSEAKLYKCLCDKYISGLAPGDAPLEIYHWEAPRRSKKVKAGAASALEKNPPPKSGISLVEAVPHDGRTEDRSSSPRSRSRSPPPQRREPTPRRRQSRQRRVVGEKQPRQRSEDEDAKNVEGERCHNKKRRKRAVLKGREEGRSRDHEGKSLTQPSSSRGKARDEGRSREKARKSPGRREAQEQQDEDRGRREGLRARLAERESRPAKFAEPPDLATHLQNGKVLDSTADQPSRRHGQKAKKAKTSRSSMPSAEPMLEILHARPKATLLADRPPGIWTAASKVARDGQVAPTPSRTPFSPAAPPSALLRTTDQPKAALRVFAGAETVPSKTSSPGVVRARVQHNGEEVLFTLPVTTTLAEVAEMYGRWMDCQAGGKREVPKVPVAHAAHAARSSPMVLNGA